jgi:signal transduction histidine kinase
MRNRGAHLKRNQQATFDGLPGQTQGSTSPRLSVLLVEDSVDDASLVVRELERGGFVPTIDRVETQAAFNMALASGTWDVIISDYTLPQYSGLSALADLRATGIDIPFILVSGTVGESGAVTIMKAGAQDFVLKGDLSRLPRAVVRELRDAAVRSEQARMRDQLVISERMASAGTLAAGVAHEINNPLAVAMANMEFISETLSRLMSTQVSKAAPTSDWSGWSSLAGLEEPMRDTREALVRMRDIVRDVKLFSSPHEAHTDGVDLLRIIDSSIRMAWNEIRHRARIVKDYQSLPLVRANESRLGQVILNLIVNAAQAMPEGQADRNELRVSTRTHGVDRVVVEITDTGTGISEENLEKIFQPFFTTKAPGVGTGLGLAICHRIVAELGGLIEIESEVGKGTLVRLELPAVRESQTLKVKTTRPLPAQRARVLVIDDEPAIGRALQRTLREHLDVTALTSAREVIRRIEGGERFDVIISDLMMPDVTGMELYEYIVRLDADQARRMVFVTGGAFTTAAREFFDRVSNPRIEKPVEVANLLAIITGLVQPPDFALA